MRIKSINLLFIIYLTFITFLLHTNSYANNHINLTTKEKEWIKKHPKIIFGTDENWTPYVIKNENGELEGIELDLLNHINSLAGTNIQLVVGNWNKMLQDAKSKKIDGLALSVAHKSRESDFVFSKGLYNIYKYIFTDDKNIKSLEDLEGKWVSYQKGNLLEEKLLKSIKNVVLVPLTKEKEHIEYLKAKKVDASIGGLELKRVSKQMNGPKISFAIPKSEATIVYSIRNDWEILQTIINKALEHTSYSEIEAIIEKWDGKYKDQGLNKELNFTIDEKNWLARHNEIRMCVLPNWLPFEQIDEKIQHKGIGADIMDLVSNLIQTPIRLIPTNEWSESLNNIREKKCDILPVAMDIPSRRDAMNFTKPYWAEPFVIATKEDKFFIKDSSEIGSKKIGIVKSYAFIEVLKSRNPGIEIVEVENAYEGLKMVQNDELFGYVDIMAAVGYTIQKYGFYDLKIAGKLEFDIKLSVASRIDEPLLNSIMQKTLDNIGEDRIRTIVGKWIEIKVHQAIDYTKLVYITIGFLLIIFIIVYKNRSINSINKKLKIAYDELNEQKKMLDSLSQYQQNLLSLFDKSDAVLFKWKYNLNLDTEYVSLSIKKLLGYESKEFTSGKVLYLSCVHKDDLENLKKQLRLNLENGVDYFKHEPYRVITKDGETKWVLDYIVTLKDEKGVITHTLGYITDITDYIKQQELVLQQSKMASLGEMIGNISHQWRQPLSVISTVATGTKLRKELNILKEEELNLNMDLINNNAQFLSKTIDDFKNFIKGERSLVEFNVFETIEQVLTLVQASTVNNYIKVILDCQKDIVIKGYPNEFIQSIINLYNNSKDVLINLPEDERFIFIDLKKDKEYLYLTIKDNGGGVDKKIKDKIFEPYITTKHKSMGTGLGLNITYNFIVTGMNGNISVENINFVYEEKKYTGAKFSIKIPLN